MPFNALLPTGERIISTQTSNEEWDFLKRLSRNNELIMSWSGKPCVPKISRLGTKYFAHKPGHKPDGIDWKETLEHLKLKQLVIEYAVSHGWEAQTEVMSANREWIADTLLIKGDRKIAIEIQWSRQSAQEYDFRTQRYAQDGVECWWVTRHMPTQKMAVEKLVNTNNIIFIDNPDDVFGATDSQSITLQEWSGETCSLDDFLDNVMSQKYCRFFDDDIEIVDRKCNDCERFFLVYFTNNNIMKYQDVLRAISTCDTENYCPEDSLGRKIPLCSNASMRWYTCPYCEHVNYFSNDDFGTSIDGGADYFYYKFFIVHNKIYPIHVSGNEKYGKIYNRTILTSEDHPVKTAQEWNHGTFRARFKGFVAKDVLAYHARFEPYSPEKFAEIHIGGKNNLGRKKSWLFHQITFNGFPIIFAYSDSNNEPPHEFFDYCQKNNIIPLVYGQDFYIVDNKGLYPTKILYIAKGGRMGFVSFEYMLDYFLVKNKSMLL